jgi:hypothetical protein
VKKQSAAKASVQDTDARTLEARRAFAIQVISALADEARSYKSESLRASVQAKVADLLWDVDQPRARTLFNRAWDVAEAVDKEGRRRNQEERRRFLSGQGGTGFIPPPPNLRAEVLQVIARRDRELAESFLARMEDDNKREEEESKLTRYWDPTEPPEAVAKRLELARQLLESGETERALSIAVPGLNRVTSQGIIFLVLLRKKNPVLADGRYASLLERAAADSMSDATSVSLLSSYVFTPSVLVTATRSGLLMNPWTETLPPPDLSPSLRAAFFRVAAQILLRPIAPPELERTSAGRSGTYFTITRLLPMFEQYDREVSAALQARLNLLAQGAGEIIPEQQRTFINAGFNQREAKEEGFDDTLARIERTPGVDERDHLSALAARAAVIKNDPKARELADKIENSGLRKRVRTFVDFILVSRALEKRDAEKALRLARTGELTAFQRSWAYTEIAGLLKTSAPDDAAGLIRDAVMEAGHISATSPENAQAWIAITRRTIETDPARVWETALQTVSSINKTQDYTGEEDKIPVRFQSRNTIAMMDVAAPSISLTNLFETIGEEDLYLAVDMARSITTESPRAIALLAATRSILKAGKK